MTGPNTTERFEHAWNNYANVFFVDQPIGVGFSYADYGEQIACVSFSSPVRKERANMGTVEHHCRSRQRYFRLHCDIL